jgi:hypothetical protein
VGEEDQVWFGWGGGHVGARVNLGSFMD